MKWNCHIPGKPNTDWEGGYFPLTMEFSEEYPARPPKVSYFQLSLRGCESDQLNSKHPYSPWLYTTTINR